MLNFESPVPLYHQLADIIAAGIEDGKYPEGTAIPSEIELKNRYNIGRPTVRQALDLLVKKNLIFKKRGSGTFVKKLEKKEVDLFSLAGTSLAFGAQNIEIETTIIAGIALIEVDKDRDNPFFDESAYCISRLIKAEAKPVIIETTFFHPLLFRGIDTIDLTGKSLAKVVSDHYYLTPESGRQIFKIISLNRKNAAILNMDKDDKILEVKRTINFPGAKQAVYSRILCKTDEYAFSQVIFENIK